MATLDYQMKNTHSSFNEKDVMVFPGLLPLRISDVLCKDYGQRKIIMRDSTLI